MLRALTKTASCMAVNIFRQCSIPTSINVGNLKSNFVPLNRTFTSILCPTSIKSSTLLNTNLTITGVTVPKVFPMQDQTRTVTKFSLRKGKRKSVKAVLKRFYRLNWGAWIRTRAGRQKKLWKRSAANKYRKRQHIFVNGTQAWLLDKCVTKFWRRPKYYINDIYEPYHKRPECPYTHHTKWIY